MYANISDAFFDQSAAVIQNQKFSNTVVITVSVIGVFMSSIQIIVTALWKPLRTLDHSLICFIAVGDVSKGIFYGSICSKRLYLASYGWHEVTTQLDCMYWMAGVTISNYIVISSILLISIDRMLALSFPVWFINRKRYLKISAIVGSVIIGALLGSTIFIGARSDLYQLACTSGASPPTQIRAFLSVVENIFSALIVTINVISCTIVYIRWRKAIKECVRTGNNVSMTRFKSNCQVNALKTLIIIVFLFLSSVYASVIFVSVLNSSSLTDAQKQSYAPISGCLTLSRGVFDFLVYLCMCREYREALISLMVRMKWLLFAATNSNAVIPIA